MNEFFKEIGKLSWKIKIISYLALAFLLSLTLLVWRYYDRSVAEKDQHRFDESVNATVDGIRGRLDRYSMILHGAAGLFAASENVTRKEWRAYCEYRQVNIFYPGIQGLGFATVVRPAGLARHIQDVRDEGYPDYTMRPSGARDVYTSIIYLEPFDARNQRAFGYDMFSEPVRQEAMIRARDTGAPAVSGKVRLVQETDKDIQPGFLMFLPVYANGMPSGSVEERRSAIRGYVYAPFRIRDLLRAISSNSSHTSDFLLYDGAEPSPASMMFNSCPSPDTPYTSEFTSTKHLEIYGHPWTAVFKSTPTLHADCDHFMANVVLGGGLAISLMTFLLINMLAWNAGRAITLARKMTSALRDSEDRYRTLTDTLPFGVSIIGPNMEILASNKTKRRWFPGLGGKQIPPCYGEYNTPPRTQPCEGCPVVKAFQDKQPHSAEREAVTVMGRRILSITAVPITNADGQVACVHETVEDVTEIKKTEQALRHSEMKWRTIFENATDGFLLVDPEDTCFIECNAKMSEMLGYSADEIKTLRVEDIHPSDALPRILETFHMQANGEMRVAHDIPVMRKDHSVFYADIGTSLLTIDGRRRMLGMFRDITDVKQMEQDRIARRAAESATREKSVFLSNMSHEIRTPLNVILGFSQILACDPCLPPKQKAQIQTVNRSGKHLLNLINDILDMSKIEAGMTTLKPAVFSLHDLLDDLQTMFTSQAEAKGLRLLMERDADLPRHLLGDEGRLRQILVNLMGNAIKFTGHGGVTVRTRAEAADTQTSRLVVEVEDSGPGISKADIRHIFAAFQQTEAGAKAGGTGLGLAISHSLVEMMGGHLTVESEVDKGSCFQFDVRMTLPGEIPKTVKTQSRQVVGIEPGPVPWRILVVDDMQDNRALLCELLRPIGFEIREAVNGAQALDVFHEWMPHAVLMDMRMPVMDGYEATRRIKASESGRDAHVIAVTASSFKDSEAEVMATGVSAYLRKPFRTEELYEILGKCLGGRYVYADSKDSPRPMPELPPVISRESIAALPADLTQAMRKAVEEGDMARMTELIGHVVELDATAGQGLQALASRYEYDKLEELLNGKGTYHG